MSYTSDAAGSRRTRSTYRSTNQIPTASPTTRMTSRSTKPSLNGTSAKPEAIPVANGLTVDPSTPMPAPSRITNAPTMAVLRGNHHRDDEDVECEALFGHSERHADRMLTAARKQRRLTMTTATHAPAAPGETSTDWYRLAADDVCARLGVDPAVGLSTAEVAEHRKRYGSNKLAEEAKEPGWRAFLRQYRDLMQLVLVGAAVVSVVALQDISTGLVVLGLTVVNALMGLHQEGKAAESVASLRKMLIITASVRREGQIVEVPAEELVPGDIVGLEAGDKVPADGRILVAATLEIEEAGLTGESTPVAKSVSPVTGVDIPLGDRVDMAYMNSQVTRGRSEMVVTATGMSTEVGHISGMLGEVEQEKTPLTKQLDQLTVVITIMAALALVAIIVLGLARGDDFDSLFLVGISLAISAIPTGLPAVVTMLLSLGTRQLAGKGAIVKRLRSVETLGSTSAICSDKTGTLTLN